MTTVAPSPSPTLNFTPPPRRVPLSLKIANTMTGTAQLGWFLFGFGMIFVWSFAGHADYSFIEFYGERGRALGVIDSVQPTSFTVDNARVMANGYEFSAGGRTFHGVAYSTGSAAAPGQKTWVEYIAGKPQMSRIAGMRRAAVTPWVLVVVVIPLVGIGLVGFAWGGGRIENQLLRDGILTTGVLKEKTATNTSVNNARVYRMTFEFTARDGTRHKLTSFTNAPHRLSDEAREPLLYDPQTPERAYLLDNAPSRPKLDGGGELLGRPVAAFFKLIIPVIVLALNGLWALAQVV